MNKWEDSQTRAERDVDTRGILESDMHALCAELGEYVPAELLWNGYSHQTIIGRLLKMLDRQAAITEREVKLELLGDSEQPLTTALMASVASNLAEKNGELRKEIAELRADRDKLVGEKRTVGNKLRELALTLRKDDMYASSAICAVCDQMLKLTEAVE